MTYPRDILDAAHRHSSNHRDELEGSWICGCFYCCQTCDAAEVEYWLDEGTGTALCPNCDIDAVIGATSGYPVNEPPFRKAMHGRWFSVVSDCNFMSLPMGTATVGECTAESPHFGCFVPVHEGRAAAPAICAD